MNVVKYYINTKNNGLGYNRLGNPYLRIISELLRTESIFKKCRNCYLTLEIDDNGNLVNYTVRHTTSGLIKTAMGIYSAPGHYDDERFESKNPNVYITTKELEIIAKYKLKELKTDRLDVALMCIFGTLRSMHLDDRVIESDESRLDDLSLV